MARSSKAPLSGARRYVVNQGGAPDPETTKDTITIGRQPDEDKAPKAASPKS